MRVMVFVKANKNIDAGVMPTRQEWEAMEQFNEDLVKAGILISGEGLKRGVRVRYSGKDPIVTDGPFTETKETIAGYSIWEVKSMEEAIAWAKRCPMPEDSEIEIRPLFTYSSDEVSKIVSQSE